MNRRLAALAVFAAVFGGTIQPVMAEIAMGYWSWDNVAEPLDLGPASDRTCFLQGVTGQLEGEWKGPRASVSVRIENDRWILEVSAGVGIGVRGHATCIDRTSNRKFMAWAGNSENNPFNKTVEPTSGPRGPLTQCFLTSVTGTDGWKSPNSFVRLAREEVYENGQMVPKWTLSGDLLWEQDNTAGGSAGAVCVDIWQLTSSYGWHTWSGSAGETGFITPLSKTVCSVQRLVGNFAAAPLALNDGVRVFPSGNGWWSVFSSTGKGIYGECLKDLSFEFFPYLKSFSPPTPRQGPRRPIPPHSY